MKDVTLSADKDSTVRQGSRALAQTIADRFNAILARTNVRDIDTGEMKPITIPQLSGFAEDRYLDAQVPVSPRHLYRLSRAETYPRIDTLWLLGDVLSVHPAYFLGADRATPKRFPDYYSEPPNTVTRGLARTLNKYVSATADKRKMSIDELLERIESQAEYEPVSTRHLERLLKGTALPRLNTLAVIAKVIGLDLVELVAGPEPKPTEG